MCPSIIVKQFKRENTKPNEEKDFGILLVYMFIPMQSFYSSRTVYGEWLKNYSKLLQVNLLHLVQHHRHSPEPCTVLMSCLLGLQIKEVGSVFIFQCYGQYKSFTCLIQQVFKIFMNSFALSKCTHPLLRKLILILMLWVEVLKLNKNSVVFWVKKQQQNSPNLNVICPPTIHIHSSFVGEKTIQPMLLEVNFGPDNSRISKLYPNFINESFAALFYEDFSSGNIVQLQ